MSKTIHKNTSLHNPILRILFGITSLLLLCWSLLPYIRNRIMNEGIKSTVVVTLLIIISCILWDKLIIPINRLWKHKVGRLLLIFISFVIIILFALFITVSCFMLYAAAQKPSKQSTILVLGAAVRTDGPSAMLADRLDSAVKYLNDNDQSVCIVSGGQGTDEPVAEADVMYTYLINKGIDRSRIFKEDQSKNTEENIRYSKAIIERENLCQQIVIATQEFHQYRAQSIARHEGLKNISPCTCRTKLYLLECYWVREFAAICRFWILGY